LSDISERYTRFADIEIFRVMRKKQLQNEYSKCLHGFVRYFNSNIISFNKGKDIAGSLKEFW